MTLKNALLEIGTEHLPARFLAPALAQLKTLTETILAEKRLDYKEVQTFGTYRKLVVFVNGLAATSADMQKEVKGPSAKLLKDANGNFTAQAAGFAQKNGLPPEKLDVVDTDKGPFLYARVHIKGEKTEKLLPAIFTHIVTGLEFAKNMVWEETALRYGRPIRSLIGLYGDKLVKFTVAGVSSSRYTHGLLSFGNKPLKVERADKAAYVRLLANQNPPIFVLPQDRREALIKSVNAEANARGYQADLDERLIAETVAFTEHPVAVCGDMDLKALTLPKLLITTVLKEQLKMFPVMDKKGNLQPYFIAVRDGSSANQNEVRDGFKKVMSARLSDAVFFFENDQKEGLASFHEKLKNIQFLEGVGTLADKAKRVQTIARALAKHVGVDEQIVSYAALHCYDDLASHVVYEFPELQGYMGGQYQARCAHNDAEKQAALAMQQCYWPMSSSAQLPTTPAGNIVSLAGKLDTLAGNFLIGQIPSGSEDPFALRRQAFAVVRILLENKWNLSIRQALGWVQQAYGTRLSDPTLTQLTDFLAQRLTVVLQERGRNGALLKAVSNWADLPLNRVEQVVHALEQVQRKEEFAALREAAKRVCNILKKSPAVAAQPDEKLFETAAERNLFATAQNLVLNGQDDLKDLTALSAFKQPLEQFFKDVMVNVPDEKLRTNRLALLAQVRQKLTQSVADISCL
ncbi:MAG: glycine--tRNA ligase subunit beta [Elusimicrobiaceae bacterium]|nr:glycine--tRNA ligase subunit beta [Elusimicrobiaceae bacterium]